MKHLIAPLALCLMLTPLHAQEAAPEGDVDQGFSLMEEGAKLLLRGLMENMEPALDDMGQALTELEPALRELMVMIGDLRNYEAPEKLPNGDIIIRRKPDAPMAKPAPEVPDMSPDADIEL
ncbi:AAA+ family ATPase [Fertoebacter nigrum]|uniref:AAA+ family ATPase n=1 Tax=Fertoeibacter niger TaxID=2656921 RepID=A0A8X8GZ89_9RHOB|nr:AAA+ family ATPase [Fertoeibacter niger]NUB43960.1 AAA+ family ATPase [Fertoeibacter niger]